MEACGPLQRRPSLAEQRDVAAAYGVRRLAQRIEKLGRESVEPAARRNETRQRAVAFVERSPSRAIEPRQPALHRLAEPVGDFGPVHCAQPVVIPGEPVETRRLGETGSDRVLRHAHSAGLGRGLATA